MTEAANAPAAPDTRIYLVESAAPAGKRSVRLVRARNPSRARLHVTVEPDVRLPTQDELVSLAAQGVQVEDAK